MSGSRGKLSQLNMSRGVEIAQLCITDCLWEGLPEIVKLEREPNRYELNMSCGVENLLSFVLTAVSTDCLVNWSIGK